MWKKLTTDDEQDTKWWHNYSSTNEYW
jgi:hypothetical protein